MTAITPSRAGVEIKMDPKPTLPMRVADKIRGEIKLIEAEAKVYRMDAERSKAHNESTEFQKELIEQADFFTLNAEALKISLNWIIARSTAKG